MDLSYLVLGSAVFGSAGICTGSLLGVIHNYAEPYGESTRKMKLLRIAPIAVMSTFGGDVAGVLRGNGEIMDAVSNDPGWISGVIAGYYMTRRLKKPPEIKEKTKHRFTFPKITLPKFSVIDPTKSYTMPLERDLYT